MSFADDIRKFSQNAQKGLDLTVREITFGLFSSVVLKTPVDTGLLRGNWQVTTQTPATSATDRTSNPIGSIKQEVGGLGSITYMANNLPYAASAEYGYWVGPTAKVTPAGFSAKAPQGMVRLSMTEIQRIAQRAAARVRRSS